MHTNFIAGPLATILNLITMKNLIYLLLFFYPFCAYGQSDKDYWEKWDSNYPVIDILKMLDSEKHYADSVEKNPKITPYYVRSDRYRFDAEYIGKVRVIDKSIKSTMRIVYKLTIGNPKVLDDLIDSEVLIKLGKDTLWMPVQKNILRSLKDEINNGDTLTLYCLYLNEHSTENGLRNIFIISEFNKK